jgi:nitrite reductase/ring-hydroxylating ferredoxin subunit
VSSVEDERRVRVAPGVRVPGAGDLADGELRAVTAGGRKLVVARVGDQRYACANRCPHYGIRLSDGHLEGSVLECRWHHWRFDLATGCVDAEESTLATIETYAVDVDGDDLVVRTTPRTRFTERPERPDGDGTGGGANGG